MEPFQQALENATTTLPPGTDFIPARFSLLLKAVHDPVAKRREIAAALTPFDPAVIVRPLSTQEQRVLVAEFPDRTLGLDDPSSFAAAYAMSAAFDLEAAEPDLPTNFFPQPLRSLQAKEPAREEAISFPPGCFVPAEPDLDHRPLWALDAIRAREAWAFSEQLHRPDRGAGIVIAQPDTGITNHPELAGVAQSSPFDVLDQDSDPTDPLDEGALGNPGHGTGTASVLVSPESRIVAGAAPKATHMPVRAIKSVLRITQGTVAEAIEWAVEHGAHIITMSLGGIPSFALHRALRRAVGADVIVLAAAGNCVKLVVWPARYEDAIAVAGIDSEDRPWKGTCRGSAVAVSAPGQNVIRAQVEKGKPPSTGQGQGTSFATPLTAGAAALWLAHHGRANLIRAARERGETLQTMFRRLAKATARRPPNWDGFNMGAGIVDARALLEADLDAGRERESAPLPDVAEERDRVAMESFVLEATSAPAALDGALDWRLYGPEIATAILKRRLSGGFQTEAMAGPPVSRELSAAVRNPVLREALGI